MPVFAAPAFLLAGALAALVPLALHLIRRRPPERAPLPTARFLSEDARTAVRVSRPTDAGLLALRMLLLLLLGAGLARPSWVPAAAGTVPLVLLDRAVSAEAWAAGVAEARRGLAAGGALVLFDSVAEVVVAPEPAFFDSLLAAGPSPAAGDYAAALRAVPGAVRGLRGADSVRVRLVSSFSEGGWSPGVGEVRARAWPGAVELLPVAGGASAEAASGEGRRAVVVAERGGRFAEAALAALGYETSRASGGALPDGASLYVALDPSSELRARLLDHARDGATVVVSATAEGEAGGELWLTPELRLAGGGPGRVPQTAPADRVVAVWDDGRPAATARPEGAGCVVEVGTGLEDGELPFQAAYPAALGRLARGCAGDGDGGARRLDAGALALLRGDGPAAVPAGAADPERAGTALGRWLLLAALAVALAETAVAYGRRG